MVNLSGRDVHLSMDKMISKYVILSISILSSIVVILIFNESVGNVQSSVNSRTKSIMPNTFYNNFKHSSAVRNVLMDHNSRDSMFEKRQKDNSENEAVGNVQPSINSRTNSSMVNTFHNNFTSVFMNVSMGRNSRDPLFEKRKKHISENCKKINKTIESRLSIDDYLVDKIHSIYYCPIPKVGSTFWKRTLEVLASSGKIESPFDLTLKDVILPKVKQLSNEESNDLKNHGNSFMFVRNPYARLFSGYENKLYCPNLPFWKSIGRQVIQLVRQNHNNTNLKFGFDVTFPEFIRFIVLLHRFGGGINSHFLPMINTCNPCKTHFDYIGRLEMFTDDANFIISKWKTKFDDINITLDEKESTFDSLRSHIRFLFVAKQVIKTIKIPFIKLMLRTWRDLQIRGLLSKAIAFPFNASNSERITQEDFMNAVKQALDIPVNYTEVKQQRYEALVQAYRQVPLFDMEELRKYLLQDCLIFNYDDRPKNLFDRSTPLSDNFTYLDGM